MHEHRGQEVRSVSARQMSDCWLRQEPLASQISPLRMLVEIHNEDISMESQVQ